MGHSSVLQNVNIDGIKGVFTGGSIRCGNEIIEVRGAGKELPYELRDGLPDASGSIDLTPDSADIGTLINKALFVSGTPADELGSIDTIGVDGGMEKYTHTECYIESLELSGEQNGVVTASLSWRAKSFAEGTAVEHGGFESSKLFDDVEDVGQSFTISISNTLAVKGKLGSDAIDYIEGTGQSISVTRVSSVNIGTADTSWIILGKTWGGKVEYAEMPIEEDGDIVQTAVMIVNEVT